jgi:serine/threonine protein kinase
MTSHSSQDRSKPQAPHEYLYQKGASIAERYDVIEPLGFGGFSEVYHCRDTKLRRDVAVKVVLQGEKGDTALTEAHAAAQLKHPHIVEVYDVVKDEDGHPVIIFQYVQGQTLEASLFQAPHRRLPLESNTLKIVEQLAGAIDYAHAQGVIHRDIKPSNVIIDRRGNAYLTDFGLAEVKMPDEPMSMLTADMQNRFSGTLPYMSPEQIVQGQQGDARSDIYSFGIVVYEMLTGRFPYPGRETQLIFQIGAAQPEPPRQTNPELPESIDPVFLQVLSKVPQERPESCQIFAENLAEATQAHVDAEAKYLLAQKAFDEKNWSQALIAFAAIQQTAPGFRDSDDKVQEARKQVQLLGKREQAQTQIKRGDYAAAFATLDTMRQMDAEYDASDVLQSLLDVLYLQAVQQFEAQQYEDCEQTLDTIRSHQAEYPDLQEIEAPAREGATKQRHWRDLYDRGVAYMKAEEWDQAVVTFEELESEASHYEDSEVRLDTARHFAVLAAGLATARAQLADGQYAACFDSLKELQRLSKTYKQGEGAQLRTAALTGLHEYARCSLDSKQFEACLTALAELEQRTQDYSDIADLRQQANEGIRTRILLAELTELYAQARDFESQEQYSAALERWREIQQKRGDLEFPDTYKVESHAKNGLCGELYRQAVDALGQQQPDEARACWERVLEIDERYPDRQRVVQRATDMKKTQAEQQARERERALAQREQRGKLLRAILIGGGIVIVIVLLIGLAEFLPGVLTPVLPPAVTPTQPASPTTTPPPVPTTAVPVSTPTPLPPDTPVPATPTPPGVGGIATVLQPSTIYAQPGTNSAELAYIQPGEQVAVSGRSTSGNWFYVLNNNGAEGYVAKDRLQWEGNPENLPVMTSPGTGGAITPGSTPIAARSPTPRTPVEGLTLDLWPLPWTAKCLPDGTWTMSIFMSGHGANGVYTYYWNGDRKGGPMSTDYTFVITGTTGQQGAGRVVSGDGLQLEQPLRVNRPACP